MTSCGVRSSCWAVRVGSNQKHCPVSRLALEDGVLRSRNLYQAAKSQDSLKVT